MFCNRIAPKLGNLKYIQRLFINQTSIFTKLRLSRYSSNTVIVEAPIFDGMSISDANIQKYLQSMSNEYYILRVTDNMDKISRERLFVLSHIVELFEQRKCILDNLKSLKEMAEDKDPDMKYLANEEKKVYMNILNKLDYEIMDGLLKMDESLDYNSLILEVTAGVGGQEAMLFAREVFDMYSNYVDFKGWDNDVIQLEHTDVGGIRHASTIVTGKDAYKFMKVEAGVHRVQRIPVTEKSGRVHTSTITVAVIPRPDDFDLQIKEKDLKFETKRASGAGGQHVNTTDSAVRLVHLPSGIAVECQTERSQLKNKEIALKKLEAKLLQQYVDKKQASENSTRKSQVGQSNRNEKIRTYNFNQDRITDHRIENGTSHNLEGFLEGNYQLDQLINRVSSSNRKKELLEVLKQYDV